MNEGVQMMNDSTQTKATIQRARNLVTSIWNEYNDRVIQLSVLEIPINLPGS